MFVDQVLTVLRLAVDRMNVADQDGVQVDLSDLLLLLLRYTHRMGRDDSSLRMKIKFCQLVQSTLSKTDCVVWTNEESLKNTILESIVDWAVDAQRVS
jgi:hypothetical protein